MNLGITTSKRTKESDEYYTPSYAIFPLLEYISKDLTIWCPFDLETSNFVKIFEANGLKVIHSHLEENKDFFNYEPINYDIIISNPPYSCKDLVFKRLYELNKPYAMLVPIPTLQGVKRFKYLENIQYLGFDKRIHYYTDKEMTKMKNQTPYGSCYLCKNFLPKDLILKELIIN